MQDGSTSLHACSTVLWRQRRLLELLLYRLEALELLVAAGRTRWLPQAAREVEAVLAELCTAELQRAVEVEHARAALSLTGTPTLRQLAAAAPRPWATLLREHHRALSDATDELRARAVLTADVLAVACPPGDDPAEPWAGQVVVLDPSASPLAELAGLARSSASAAARRAAHLGLVDFLA